MSYIKTQSAQKAKETKIFIIEDGEVTETNEYDHIMASERETTSPRGVMPKRFYEFNEESEKYIIKEWRVDGSLSKVDEFDTEEEADDEIFTKVYNFDFLPDDQRDCAYWYTNEDAEKELTYRNSNQ